MITAERNAEHHYNTGMTLRKQRMIADAIPCFQRAVDIRPDFIQARYALGKAFWEMDDCESALKELQDVVRVQPDHADALNLIGLILYSPLGKIDLAERTLLIALRANPYHVDALVNLGNILAARGRFDEAIAQYRKAIELAPMKAGGYTNLGVLYQSMNKIEEANALYTAALTVEPDHANSHWNLATALLVTGDFERGWAEFEWRPLDRPLMNRTFLKPRLTDHDIIGKTVYVHDEQGLGDTIQFVRFLPLLKSCGASVVLECHQGLGGILRGVVGVDGVVERAAPVEPTMAYDYHIPLLSLPCYLGTGDNTLPSRLPYIAADAGSFSFWKTLIVPDDRLNVGIVWAGSPHHKNDVDRSCTLDDFSLLGELDHVRLFSLQKGDAANQLSNAPMGTTVVDLGKRFADFSDTASALACLDLVITVDTSVAHLAGAMNKPVWTLLPHVPDWRWMFDREDTPWYPSMRLFRQSSPGDWRGVMEKVVFTLKSIQSPRLSAELPVGQNLQNHLREAMDHHRHGRPEIAEPLYRDVLQFDPQNELALHFLGLLRHESGDSREALELIREAIALNPFDADIHTDAGKVHMALGNPEGAAEEFQKALRLDPENAEVQFNLGCLHLAARNFDAAVAAFEEATRRAPDIGAMHKNLGVALLERKDYPAAEASCREAVRLLPEDAEARNNLGNVLRAQGRQGEAMEMYEQALRLNDKYPEAHYNLAVLLTTQKKDDEALRHFETALSLKPEFAEVYSSLGNLLKQRGQTEASIEYFRNAIRLKPGLATAHNNLGSALLDRAMFHEAAASFNEALRLDPGLIQARNNLGNALRGLGDSTQAIQSFREVLAVEPATVEAYFNIAATLADQHQFELSIEHYDRAIAIKPDYAEAHLNKAMVQLLLAQLPQAWDEYDWRLQMKEVRKTLPQSLLDQLAWDGSPLEGRSILVHFEQGFGDTLQFIRYLPMVKALGGTVLFECQKELATLLRDAAGVDQLLEGRKDRQDISFDTHISLLSLPKVFGTKIETIPWQGPYIDAPDSAKERWRGRMSAERVSVGIVWAGNPAHKNDYNRSCPFTELEALTRVQGVQVFSLQKGAPADNLHSSPFGERVIGLGEELTDFCETAAVISHMDVVISVDTAVAHLAGAMGKRIWTLLPYAPDWRWLLDRDDSPWYPTMRLFRQSRPGDWKGVLENVGRELSAIVAATAGGGYEIKD